MKIDIKGPLKDAKVAIEGEALKQFGAVVEDFTRGVLGLTGPASIQNRQVPPSETSQWYASSYAAVLSGSSFRPKLKFLFKVQFFFDPDVISDIRSTGLVSSETLDRIIRNEFTFMIKAVDRPKVDFEYEDEVNYYNYRTKALKRIRHRELTITFMDDIGNRVFDFFRILMFIYSPITRESFSRANPLDLDQKPDTEGGMGFLTSTIEKRASAHRGVVNAKAGQAIRAIRLRQMFVNTADFGVRSNSPLGEQQVMFDFYNPRLVSFDLDDLTHESSDPNLLTMQFDYDYMTMTPVSALSGQLGGTENKILADKTTGVPADVVSGVAAPQKAGYDSGSARSGQGGGGVNPFGAVLQGAAARAARKITGEIVNKSVRSIAGNGLLGTTLSSAIGGPIRGLVDGAVRDAVGVGIAGFGGGRSGSGSGSGGGLFSSISATAARARSALTSDSAGNTSRGTIQSSSSATQTQNPVIDNRPGGGI